MPGTDDQNADVYEGYRPKLEEKGYKPKPVAVPVPTPTPPPGPGSASEKK